MIINFLYLYNYKPNIPLNIVHQSNNPLFKKNSNKAFRGGSTLKDRFAKDTAREKEERIKDSITNANQVDGGIDPIDNCAVAVFSPVNSLLRGGVLIIYCKIYMLSLKYYIPSL